MANRAGLKKVTKMVHGKKGTVKRSYWIKAKEGAKSVGGKVAGAARAAGGFLKRHKGKIAAGAGLAAAAYGAYKGAKFVKGYRGMGMSHGDAAKAIVGGLKERAKDAATRGAHAVVGVGAKAHKAASDARGAARKAAGFVKGAREAGMSRSSIAKNAAAGLASRAGSAIASGARAAGSRVRKAVSRKKAE